MKLPLPFVTKPWLALVFALVIATVGLAGTVFAVAGNINPMSIEIDPTVQGSGKTGLTEGANLYLGSSTANCSSTLTANGLTDWVKDCLANTDPPSLVDSIATGVKTASPDQTGAVAQGHWNGVRIVDGVAQGDKDIFLTGGKENDTSTWNVGPGSIGSSKYDISQAYLANNQQALFFGMERSGNNGTTAFDFEFNKLAPSGGPGTYIPNRSIDDVLFTFEMNGSGSSGSATPYYFRWDGSQYVQLTNPASLFSSINQQEVPAAPWGYVNSNGQWVTGNIPRFQFAEASISLQDAFGVTNPCGSSFFTQVRTRASATPNSDLKDTTKIFEFQFGGPNAEAQLSTVCETYDANNPNVTHFTYGSAGSQDSTGGTNLTYNWDITVSPGSATLSGGGVSAVDTNAGKYTSTSASGTVAVDLGANLASATITVKNTVTEGGACSDSTGNKTVTVYRALHATATLTAKCDRVFEYSSTVSGGQGPYTYAWSFKNADGVQVGTSTTASGEFTAPADGAYYADLTVKDTADTASSDPDVTVKGQCEFTARSNTVNVYGAVNAVISLTPDCDDTFTYSSLGSGGLAPYTYDFTIEKLVGQNWTTAGSFQATDTLAQPGVSGELDVDELPNAVSGVSGDGRYRLKVRITDSQGLNCFDDETSNTVDVRHPLDAGAVKTGANGTTLAVEVTGSLTNGSTSDAEAPVSLQWQRLDGTQWVNIAGQTSATLNYSSFDTDATSNPIIFMIGNDQYHGQQWAVDVRLHASRTLNGVLCEDDSPAVPVKKVTAVDP